jgi:hypothetical protein
MSFATLGVDELTQIASRGTAVKNMAQTPGWTVVSDALGNIRNSLSSKLQAATTFEQLLAVKAEAAAVDYVEGLVSQAISLGEAAQEEMRRRQGAGAASSHTLEHPG